MYQTSRWSLILIVCWAAHVQRARIGQADVVDASESGFSLTTEVSVAASVETTYATFAKIGSWWSAEHSWSGDAANMSLTLESGGAFLEKLPRGGFVRHLEVVAVFPEELVRLQGGLGPLQEHAVQGSMTVRLKKSDTGTVVRVTYNVGGYAPGGLKAWADPVDRVIKEQFERMKQRAEGTLAASDKKPSR